MNNYVNVDAAKLLVHQIDDIIKTLGNQSLNICEAFGVPKSSIYAPIYTGYQEYYKSDVTQGEHYNLKPKF